MQATLHYERRGPSVIFKAITYAYVQHTTSYYRSLLFHRLLLHLFHHSSRSHIKFMYLKIGKEFIY